MKCYVVNRNDNISVVCSKGFVPSNVICPAPKDENGNYIVDSDIIDLDENNNAFLNEEKKRRKEEIIAQKETEDKNKKNRRNDRMNLLKSLKLNINSFKIEQDLKDILKALIEEVVE